MIPIVPLFGLLAEPPEEVIASQEVKITHTELDGPVTLCDPVWPVFMDDLPIRDSVTITAIFLY